MFQKFCCAEEWPGRYQQVLLTKSICSAQPSWKFHQLCYFGGNSYPYNLQTLLILYFNTIKNNEKKILKIRTHFKLSNWQNYENRKYANECSLRKLVSPVTTIRSGKAELKRMNIEHEQ